MICCGWQRFCRSRPLPHDPHTCPCRWGDPILRDGDALQLGWLRCPQRRSLPHCLLCLLLFLLLLRRHLRPHGPLRALTP